MKFTDSVLPKHQKKMEMQNEIIEDMRIPLTPFPENASRQTRKELKFLTNYNEGEINKDFVKEGDNIRKVFEAFCKEHDLSFDKKYFNDLIKESKKTILQLKYYYNRPRPFQLAEYFRIEEFKNYWIN